MSRKNHRTRIYEDIRSRIQRGEIGRDDRLVDTMIAAELGVSRMPVREALMQLASEGYLEGTSRGFALPNLSHARIMEVFTLRRLLEPHAAASAAQARNEHDLAVMAEALAATESTLTTGEFEVLYRASEVFRNAWIDAIPNRELRETIRRYSGQIQSVRIATMRDPEAHRAIVSGQRALLDAISRRDALKAGERMLLFVFAGETSYLRLRVPEELAER